MRYLLLMASVLFGYEVEFTKIYKEYITPKQKTVMIETKAQITTPYKFIKTKNGYILLGDYNDINLWLENSFYPPKDTKFKDVKIAYIDYDNLQQKVLQKIKKVYKNCTLKKVQFLTPDEEKIITKPTQIVVKYKITLECK
ncbi:MAG: hypothetical protein GXO62_02070 [Epsilonproteobacteria bacterium]|nr:hypothetical protein [Campylobacterota bacterium]